MGRILGVALVAVSAALGFPVPAQAAEWQCVNTPVFGLSPYVLTICDGPLNADGSWLRSRERWSPEYVRSSCGGEYYQGGDCPPWLEQDSVPAQRSPIEYYTVTHATIPPGEPGRIG